MINPLLLLPLLLPPASLQASEALCSFVMADGSRFTLDLDATRGLVRNADVIVIARAESEEREPGQSLGRISFRVTEVLRGANNPEEIQAPGRLVPEDDWNRGLVPYVWARRGAHGPCYAYWYREGAEYLLLMKVHLGRHTAYWAPLAPTNEQVRGVNDPWVAWVRDEMLRQAASDTGSPTLPPDSTRPPR